MALCRGVFAAGHGAVVGSDRRSFLDSPEDDRCLASGCALPGYACKVIDQATGATVPWGTVGELCVRGYSLMQGYYKKPEETAGDGDGVAGTGPAPYGPPHLRASRRWRGWAARVGAPPRVPSASSREHRAFLNGTRKTTIIWQRNSAQGIEHTVGAVAIWRSMGSRRMPRCTSGEGARGVRLAAAGHRVAVRLIRHTAFREV